MSTIRPLRFNNWLGAYGHSISTHTHAYNGIRLASSSTIRAMGNGRQLAYADTLLAGKCFGLETLGVGAPFAPPPKKNMCFSVFLLISVLIFLRY